MLHALPELLLPAGNLAKLRMALRYGADAVYVGASGFSMRPDGVSFDADALREAVRVTHDFGKRIYVAVNSLIFDDELGALDAWLEDTTDIDFDAVIVADLGALASMRAARPALPIHISTQMSTTNRRSAEVLATLGAERVILARECTLETARNIAGHCPLEIEIFVHGAMCVATSGRCLLSAHLCGHSGNRGQCKHSCRWEWQLVEEKRPGETVPVYETGGQTIFLGSKDLCLIEHIPALVQSGVRSLKVEGRMKSELYVASVARTYRAALDAYAEDPERYRCDPAWLAELEVISHRPYDTGFAFGYPAHDPARMQTFNRPVAKARVAAYVRATDKLSLLEVKDPIMPGDCLEWIGPADMGGRVVIGAIYNESGEPVARAVGGTMVRVELSTDSIELPLDAILRRRDKEPA